MDAGRRQRLPHVPRWRGSLFTAKFYTRLGRSDRGLLGVRAAVERGYFCVAQFEQEPWLESIRMDPSFQVSLAAARARHERAVGIFIEEGGPTLLGVAAGSPQ